MSERERENENDKRQKYKTFFHKIDTKQTSSPRIYRLVCVSMRSVQLSGVL